MQKTYVTLIVLVLVVAAGSFFVFGSKKSEAPTIDNNQNNTQINPPEAVMPTPTPVAPTPTPTPISPKPSPTPAPTPTPVPVPIKEFTVTGQNYSFSPSSITVKKGDKVKITFQNLNGVHNLIIDEFNVGQ